MIQFRILDINREKYLKHSLFNLPCIKVWCPWLDQIWETKCEVTKRDDCVGANDRVWTLNSKDRKYLRFVEFQREEDTQQGEIVWEMIARKYAS